MSCDAIYKWSPSIQRGGDGEVGTMILACDRVRWYGGDTFGFHSNTPDIADCRLQMDMFMHMYKAINLQSVESIFPKLTAI